VASAQASGKYVIIDISACYTDDAAVAGNRNLTGNDMNIIYDNEFILGVALPNSLVTIGA